jgi:hypothetical protein
MSDSSSFRDIAQEAAEPVEEVKEVTQPAVEEPKEEQSQESFTEPVDEKSLETMTPQQLLEMRKNWERAYTAKRQKETAEIKEYQRKLAELESRPQTQASVQEKAEEAREQVEIGNMSVEEYTKYLQDLNAEQARKIAREEYQAIHKEEVETQLAERAVSDFKSVDPRLDDSNPEHNQSFEIDVKRELAELLDKHMAEHETYQGFDTKALTKAIIERKDAELDNIIKTRTQQSTQAAKMREAKMQKTMVRGTSSDSQRIGGDSIRSILSDAVNG